MEVTLTGPAVYLLAAAVLVVAVLLWLWDHR